MNPRISIVIPVYNVEKYLEDILLSVKHQSFKDFEVIIVNDGSPDNSQAIIDKFCKNDARFRCITKENGGVASARNRGLEEAIGEYVVFYDPDDFIPKHALKKLYKNMRQSNADMAVGIMKETRAGESRCNGRTIKLSKKKIISKYDAELPWSFSVCNKMFRLKMIQENNLRFQNLKHAEDALFLFQCIFAANKIIGCNTVVYEYRFRPFWESKSATQVMKVEYLNDVIKALDAIEELITKQISEEEGETKLQAEKLLNEFRIRYLHISLLNGYYRQLWSAEKGCLEILEEKIEVIKNSINHESWDKVISLNKDLQLEKNIFNTESAGKEALLTFVVPSNMNNDALRLTLSSIYEQSMPSFRVLIPNEYKEYITLTNMFKGNMTFSETCDVTEVATDYVMFLTEYYILSKNAVRFMIEALMKNQNIDYVSVPLKLYNGHEYLGTAQECAFTTLQCLKSKRTKYDELDKMHGNKVFRKDIAHNDLETLKKKKIYNANIIIFENSDQMQTSVNSQKHSSKIKLKMLQKNIEDKAINYVKNQYTKDDIKKLIRKEI